MTTNKKNPELRIVLRGEAMQKLEQLQRAGHYSSATAALNFLICKAAPPLAAWLSGDAPIALADATPKPTTIAAPPVEVELEDLSGAF